METTFVGEWESERRVANPGSEAKVYKLDPVAPSAFIGGEPTTHILVSSLIEDDLGPAETCVFLADENGDPTHPLGVVLVEGSGQFDEALEKFRQLCADVLDI